MIKLIVGPCVIESPDIMDEIAEKVKTLDNSDKFEAYF